MNIESLIKTPTIEDITTEREWITSEVEKIGLDKLKELAIRAVEIRQKSYSPYSQYKVGVSLLTISGGIYDGVNAERASYSETDHAEESAITAAIIGGEAEKSGRKFLRALVVCHSGDSAPCGRCRQIIVEHCDNAVVIMVNVEGKITGITSVKTLLPLSFTPTDLGK